MENFLKELEELFKKYKVYNCHGGYGGEVEIFSKDFEIEMNVVLENFDTDKVKFIVYKKENNYPPRG